MKPMKIFNSAKWSILNLISELSQNKILIVATLIVCFFFWLPKNLTITLKFGSPDTQTQMGITSTPIIEVESQSNLLTYDEEKGDWVENKPEKTKPEIVEDKMSDYEIAMWLLKSYESLHYESYWDVAQWTIGWGTKSKKGEVIDKNEADKRAKIEFERVYENITKRYPNLDRWQKLILAVTDYNVGTFGENLEAAILEGDSTQIAKMVKKYYHDANGKKLQGLVNRRNKEAELLTASEIKKQKIGKELKKTVLKHIEKAKNR